MNLSNLTKEQKQVLILGVIVGATVCFAGFRYGIQPLMQEWETKVSELDTMERELHAARRMVSNRDQSREELTATTAELLRAAEEYVPNKENPLSWATQKIYFQARSIGIDIEAVSEIGASGILRQMSREGGSTFESYAVRIVTACSFEDVKSFVGALQESNPYLCVSGISISARADTPMRHSVNIDVEWPTWGDRSAMERIQTLKGG